MRTQTFVRKPIPVEAVRFDGENWPEIENWSGGRVYVRGTRLPGPQRQLECMIHTDLGRDEQVRALVGDWVLKMPDGTFRFEDNTTIEKEYS